MQICLASSKLLWYLDSGCSKHMTGDSTQLINIKWKSAGYVTYGDNNRGKILGVGEIGGNGKVIIKDVLLVKGLKHSLLSISQLCDKGYKITFEPTVIPTHPTYLERRSATVIPLRRCRFTPPPPPTMQTSYPLYHPQSCATTIIKPLVSHLHLLFYQFWKSKIT